jgi:uncharacterized protein (TIGR02453 family)
MPQGIETLLPSKTAWIYLLSRFLPPKTCSKYALKVLSISFCTFVLSSMCFIFIASIQIIMIKKETFDFLKALKKNNNKDWFDKNKPKYLAAKEDVDSLVDELIHAFGTFDKSFAGLKAKDCVFRIYRDVRFAKDKQPYKTNMGASINAGGRKAETAGYYIHLEPGQCFLAGGRWMPSPDHLKKIRQEIDYNGKEFKKILNDKTFKKYFGALDQSYKLSRPPKGYDKNHPDIELLKMNSYIVWKQYTDTEMLSKNIVKELAKGAKIMKPFLDFLNTAVS